MNLRDKWDGASGSSSLPSPLFRRKRTWLPLALYVAVIAGAAFQQAGDDVHLYEGKFIYGSFLLVSLVCCVLSLTIGALHVRTLRVLNAGEPPASNIVAIIIWCGASALFFATIAPGVGLVATERLAQTIRLLW
jgi:hypothetical protein